MQAGYKLAAAPRRCVGTTKQAHGAAGTIPKQDGNMHISQHFLKLPALASQKILTRKQGVRHVQHVQALHKQRAHTAQ
jgi:hypothetical protein